MAVDAMGIARDYGSPIHLLLTDVVMPGMNGRVLAEKLRLIRPKVKVVFMSGYMDTTTAVCSIPDMLFIAKPFTRDSLLRKIREALASEDQRQASATNKPSFSDVIA